MTALLRARARASPQSPALWAFEDAAGWRPMTWRQFAEAVAVAAFGLQRLGVRRGDRIGIIAPNSPRWDIAQLAAMAAGAVVVGLDPHDTEQRLARIAERCELVGVIAQDDSALDKLGPRTEAALRLAVTFTPSRRAGRVAFADLDAAADADADWDQAHAEDAALIVFTSGTTGEPKGIVYSHRQVCVAVDSILQAFPDIEPGSRLACWLPLSNLFQRMINLCAVGRGAQTFYVQDPRTVMQHVAAISPRILIGVPRFYEKLYAGIREAIDARPARQRALADWAIRAGDRRARALRAGGRIGIVDLLQAWLADRLVLSRLRRVLGGQLRYLVSGSAPMPIWLLEHFQAIGLLVLEAYGMSESIVPVAANRPDRYRFGTVGQPLATSEVRLAADGELLLRGPGVFSGYLNDTDSAARFDADGFLASGDYASIDGEGFITLHGRNSDLFKTSTGRRIAPAMIESHLRQIPYVEHAVVFGANRPFPIAVLAVSQATLRRRLGGAAPEADAQKTAAAVRTDIAAAVAELESYQRPAGVVLTTRAFSIDEGQITANLKVKRARVEAGLGGLIDELYEALGHGPVAPFALTQDAGTALLLNA